MTNRRFIWLALALVALAYLIQLPTPLRVNTDGNIYLSLAASFNDGHGFIWHHHKAHFPSGYPAVVAMLERVGMGSSAGLITWNYLMMIVAAVLGIALLQRWLGLPRIVSVLITLLYLLSWATIRYALIPGSEMTYIAISFACLLCLTHAEDADGNARWMWWGGAILLIPLAMSVRLVGVVLPPAVLWALAVIYWRRRPAPQVSFPQWIRQHRAALIGAGFAVIIIVALAGVAVSRTSYFREDATLMFQHGILHELIFTTKQRLLEIASMLLNIPSKNALTRLHKPLTLMGIPCLLLTLLLLLRRLQSLRSVDVYLIGYVCLLLIWPYDADVRFWLPVEVPLLGLLVKELIDLAKKYPRNQRIIRIASHIYIVLFVFLGFASFAWNTRLTYSGARFSELWDVYYFRDTYRLASKNGLPVNPQAINPDLLPILRRFGARDFNR